MTAWVEAHPETDTVELHRLHASQGGGAPLQWVRALGLETDEELVPLVRPSFHPRPGWGFTERDLASVRTARDERGRPALAFELVPSRRDDFDALSRYYVGRDLAIVCRGGLLSTTVLEVEPRDSILVSSPWTEEETTRLAVELSSPLPFAMRYVGRR